MTRTTSRQHLFEGAELSRHWKQLHEGDREPSPKEPDLQ